MFDRAGRGGRPNKRPGACMCVWSLPQAVMGCPLVLGMLFRDQHTPRWLMSCGALLIERTTVLVTHLSQRC